MVDAAYFRAWRAAHPAYRQRENVRRRLARAVRGRGDRSSEIRRRTAARAAARVAAADAASQVWAHPLLDAARSVAMRYVRPDRRARVASDRFDELTAEVALAMVEGADADGRARHWLRGERTWAAHVITGAEQRHRVLD